MQRVVRSTLVGLLTLAGLTACGDKVTVPAPVTQTPGTVVHSVTVSPGSATLNVGQTITLAASVDADAGVSDRTVTWSSSDATIASVDATGKVSALKAGVASITAASKADATVKGAAVITVNGGTTTPTTPPTVTIASVNQTTAAGSVPANLQNVAGQIDVTLNVDSNGQPLKSVSATLKCGTDSMTVTQTISTAALAADAASAPVTLSFNTAAFNAANGTPSLHNGACTLSASAATTAGNQSATVSTPFTLNNADMVVVTSITTTPSAGQNATASDKNGLVWRAGAVTVAAVPVSYSGKTIATASISLVDSTTKTTIATLSNLAPASGVVSATFANNTKANGVGNVTAPMLVPVVNTIDSQGNNGPSSASLAALVAGGTFIRLDNLAPNIATVPPAYKAGTYNTANGWIGSNFAFNTDSNLTLDPTTTADNGGVDKVTFSTIYAAAGTTDTTKFNTFTSVSSIPETATGSAYDLRLKICDALGNCATTGSLTTFGVDLTAPTASLTAASIADKTIYNIDSTVTAASAPFVVSAADPAGNGVATGSGFGATPVIVSEVRLSNSGTSGSTTSCVIGTPSSDGKSCKAPAAQALSFSGATTNPGEYTVTWYVVDQAGNKTAVSTRQYYIDQTAPTVTGGLAMPASLTAGASFSTTASDNMDLASANGVIHYPIAGSTRISSAGSLSSTGVAFDNVLTRSATATYTLGTSDFYRSLGTVTAGTFSGIVKPDSVGIRAVDAAGNLSAPDEAAIPAANVATGTAYTAADLGDFYVVPSDATVANGKGGTNPTSTTLTATVVAASATATTPFTQVCFYAISPKGTEAGTGELSTGAKAGDLVLIGCSTSAVTTSVGPAPGTRVFNYTMSYNPPASYGTSGTLDVVAIGSNAKTDALMTGTHGRFTLSDK